MTSSSLSKAAKDVQDAHAVTSLAITSLEQKKNPEDVLLALRLGEALLDAAKKDLAAAIEEAREEQGRFRKPYEDYSEGGGHDEG